MKNPQGVFRLASQQAFIIIRFDAKIENLNFDRRKSVVTDISFRPEGQKLRLDSKKTVWKLPIHLLIYLKWKGAIFLGEELKER